MNETVVQLVAIVLLLGVAALMSAAETVLHRYELVRALAAEGNGRGAAALVWVMEHRASCLNVTLVVTVISRVSATVLAVAAAERWWDGAPGHAIAAVAMVLLSLVLAEVAPRTWVVKHLDDSARRLAPLVKALTRLVNPFARAVVAVGRALVGGSTSPGMFGTDEPQRAEAPSLSLDTEDSDDELEDDERAMIRSVVELGDTVVREVMVPRPDMVMVDVGADLHEVARVVVEKGYSRLPVHDGTPDHGIVGIVYAKDVLRRVALEPQRQGWDDLVKTPAVVPETKRVDDLLRHLQEHSVHIAIVADEYGQMTGLVTIEDILEEIVGEIVDEHDHEAPLVEQVGGDRWSIDARLPVDELNDLLGSELPADDWDTLGGLVVGALGRLPVVGDVIELDGARFEITGVQGRRVAKVAVQRLAKAEEVDA